MIFDQLPHNCGLETIQLALKAALQRKQILSLSDPWSFVELLPDEADSAWLRNWAGALMEETLNKARERDRKGVPDMVVEKQAYNWQHGLGVLLLFVGADQARRHAPAGEVWPILDAIIKQKDVRKRLLTSNNASKQMRDLIFYSAIRFNLRHDFANETGQSWYNTFLLQFGFSYPAFYGDSTQRGSDSQLPFWLARQMAGGATVAIDLLLNDAKRRSASFYQLWRTMAEFRRGQRDELSLRNVLQNNPWVLPQWNDDLVACLRTRRELMPQLPSLMETVEVRSTPVEHPCLQWDQQGPQFRFELAAWCELDCTDSVVTLTFTPMGAMARVRKVVFTRQSDGRFVPTTTQALIAPALCREVQVELHDSHGQPLWREQYTLWDNGADINVFTWPSGNRLADPYIETMQTSSGYVLFVADDLKVCGHEWGRTPGVRSALHDAFANAYLLTPSWSKTLELRTCEDDLVVWHPHIDVAPASRPLPATVRANKPEQRFDEETCIRIECHPNYTLEAAYWHKEEIKRVVLPSGVYLLRGARLRADRLRPRLILKLFFHRNGISEQHSVSVLLNPAGMLMQRALPGQEAAIWNFHADTELDAYDARHDRFRVFTPQRSSGAFSGGWTLWEGDVPHGFPSREWRNLPAFDGLGAPFTARTGAESEDCLPLAASVVDHGVLKSYKISSLDTFARELTLTLHHPIAVTDELELRWWDKRWQMQKWKPGNPPIDRQWRIPLSATCKGDPLAIAIARKGIRLGALWDERWYAQSALFQYGKEVETARNLRWLRLPILLSAADDCIRRFVGQHRLLLKSLWLREQGAEDWQFEGSQTESWQRAARIWIHDDTNEEVTDVSGT